ncbi:coiled-coil and C2 domain-containing protein 1-like isoform X2 [Anopheles albimanus]|uniref:Coiled-coil and C2 domain-containing protein 1-like n=1 Tax=Anopheles albimanus TaxID=7167 RepID=A0A182FUH5_ANOAL|nr:coiled-coil and C2 domain-containing protein 1-like isoform X2 [Anopheles albimanus]
MFGFSKKPAPPKRERKRDPSEFGIFGMPDNLGGIGDDVDDGSDEDDDALEAELAAIAAGSAGARKARPKPKAKGIVAPQELDAMVAASLRDIGSDEEDGDDDEDDSELLNELTTITGGVSLGNDDVDDDDDEDEAPPASSASSGNGLVALIKSRIAMYTQAEENAKKAGDSSKARRFNRGLKTLKDQLRLAEAGKSVPEADIPPEVSVKIAIAPAADNTPKPATAPVRPAPPPPAKSPKPEPEPADIDAAGPSRSPPPVPARRQAQPPEIPAPVLVETSSKVDNPKLQMLTERKLQYKQAAVMAKKAGDNVKALAYVKVLKQFDLVLAALEKGEEVDLSRMPPPPAELSIAATNQPTVPSTSKPKEEEKLQQDAEVPSPPTPMAPAPDQPAEAEDEDEGEENLIQASTVLEALEQRLDKYKSVEQAAKDEGNGSKARRMGRIVKQYQDAIKLHKAGKPIPVDELPTPPGYGPIPVDGPPKPAPAIPAKPAAPKPAQPIASPLSPASPPVPGTSKASPKPPATQFDKQLALLLERQQQYRQAAVEAKKAGELDEAKEFLRVFKGLEKMVEIARAGGRVDLSTIPIAPAKRQALEASFTIVSTDDCEQATEEAPGTGSDVQDVDSEARIRLEEQLSKQLIMCRNTRDHHRAIGDIAGMNKFENLALNVQKDLDLVRLGHRRGLPLPKFHYEKLQFSVVKCNTDLSDNEIEITIVRGINYNVANPKDVDTYVKFEFPYPQEDPIKGRTNIVKDTHSPEYNYQQTIELQRSQRNCQRIFKRHALKCEVYSKGGFLRSDALIGTVSVKLQPLETQIELHDSFPLMDGRRTVGGKLEVKIRVRNPILTKQIEQINERWVVFDS